MRKGLFAALLVSLAACGAVFCSEAALAENKEDSTVVFAMSMEPKALVRNRSSDTATCNVCAQIYESLLTQDKDMKLAPSLATSWERIDDMHYRFHLRDGVTFHNGDKFTADDVLYSFRMFVEAPNLASMWRPVDVENCKAEDPLTVVIALKHPYPAFLNLCASDHGFIVNKKAMEADPKEYAEHPVGTGPFKFVGWKTGDYLKFEANENWWGGKVGFRNLIMRYIPEATTRAIEGESGNVEVAQVSTDNAREAMDEKDRGFSILGQQTLNASYLSFNCKVKPFDNPKVRQAVALAIDAKTIVNSYFQGLCEVGTSFLAPATWGYSNVDSRFNGFDPEEARKLLTEAGYPNGFKCTLISNSRQPVCEMIQAYLANIGIQVDLNVTDFTNWLDAIVNGRQQMYVGGWTTVGDATDGVAIVDSRNFGAGGNRSFYANPEADKLIDVINTEVDEQKRAEACAKLQKLIVDEAVIIPLWVGKNFYIVNDRISGFWVRPSQIPVFSEVKFN